jgi:hypothetical protein
MGNRCKAKVAIGRRRILDRGSPPIVAGPPTIPYSGIVVVVVFVVVVVVVVFVVVVVDVLVVMFHVQVKIAF